MKVYTRTIKNSPKTGKVTLKQAKSAAKKATDKLATRESRKNDRSAARTVVSSSGKKRT